MRHTAFLLPFSLALIFALLLTLPAQAQEPDTLYVDQSASGANDGSSWNDAYVHLQDAIDEAEGIRGQVILVAEGTYYPDEDSDGDHVDDDQNESFAPGIDIVNANSELLGGYPSGGGERDVKAHRTVLSGDITQDDSTDSDGITPTASGINGDNSYHVFRIPGAATPETIIDGFVITGGQANGDGIENRGGGILNEGSPTLVRLTVAGNRASLSGGGLQNRPGAFVEAAKPFIANCTFVGNRADNGGALTNRSNSSDQEASSTVVNTVFSGNRADFLNGGAVFNFASSGPVRPAYINTTFFGNVVEGEGDASSGGGMANQGGGSDGPSAEVELHNAVLWENEAEGAGDQIHNDFGASLTVNHSLLEGGISAVSDGQNASTTDEGGNIDANPQFADASGPDGTVGTLDDDLRLQGPGSGGGASPAIDVGDGEALPPDSADIDRDGDTGEDLPIDRFGGPRVQSAAGTAVVDMGAHESDGSPLPVELSALSATQDGSSVQLTWQTASETRNGGFEVQRKAPGEAEAAWQEVGFVESRADRGTTSEPQRYRFTDESIPFETDELRYRLRQVDLGGTESFTDPVSVERRVSEMQLRKTFPNPTRGQVTVQFAVPEPQDVTLQMHDILGRTVRTVHQEKTEGRQELRLDLSGLASGAYFLRLKAGQQTQTQRLTIIR